MKINPDLDNLERLHKLSNWIPGKENIRPAPDILRQKREIECVDVDVDEMSQSLFDCDWKDALDGKGKKWHFAKNKYPYDVPTGTRHYILWFPSVKPASEDMVNKILEHEVASLGGTAFVWYENPKMTIPDMYHVQVFWV